MKNRILAEKIDIDQDSVQMFYAKRAVEKAKRNVDLPVVLCADKALEKVEAWNQYELKEWFPRFRLRADSIVFELGFGTGRISKYITSVARKYVGIDYVREFVDLINKREDVKKTECTYFLHSSFQNFMDQRVANPIEEKFDRFMLSGGVFVYINDALLAHCIERLSEFLAAHCVIYISEPIALEKRLTLDKFYSDNLESQYSAIYRTVAEYDALFAPLYEKGFKLTVNEEFFKTDIKAQNETRQWMFVLER